jgi:hypothetical protein
MNTSPLQNDVEARAQAVVVTDEALVADLVLLCQIADFPKDLRVI